MYYLGDAVGDHGGSGTQSSIGAGEDDHAALLERVGGDVRRRDGRLHVELEHLVHTVKNGLVLHVAAQPAASHADHRIKSCNTVVEIELVA